MAEIVNYLKDCVTRLGYAIREEFGKLVIVDKTKEGRYYGIVVDKVTAQDIVLVATLKPKEDIDTLNPTQYTSFLEELVSDDHLDVKIIRKKGGDAIVISSLTNSDIEDIELVTRLRHIRAVMNKHK